MPAKAAVTRGRDLGIAPYTGSGVPGRYACSSFDSTVQQRRRDRCIILGRRARDHPGAGGPLGQSRSPSDRRVRGGRTRIAAIVPRRRVRATRQDDKRRWASRARRRVKIGWQQPHAATFAAVANRTVTVELCVGLRAAPRRVRSRTLAAPLAPTARCAGMARAAAQL